MFLPVTRTEMETLGWDELDVILVTGDTYIDSPYFGTAVIGKYLLSEGYRVGVIPQPVNADEIASLGEPRLFWGVSSGCVDSLVSNYTPLGKKRNQDDLTPGGVNNRRPDRALISYTSLIRSRFKNTAPVVLGGIDASLRRVAHFYFRDNKLRRSVLFDAKADILVVRNSFLAQLRLNLIEMTPGSAHFGNLGQHRQQQLDLTIGRRTQDRAQLRAEHLRLSKA